jgi:hypothetical protein
MVASFAEEKFPLMMHLQKYKKIKKYKILPVLYVT